MPHGIDNRREHRIREAPKPIVNPEPLAACLDET